MKTKINLIIILAMGFLSIFSSKSSKAQNREQSDYYYQCYTFKQVHGYKLDSPYLTVLLYEEGKKIPKAVLMSNAIGNFSFEGVSVDLYIQNSFAVYASDRYVGTYQQHKFKKKLTFANGNIGYLMT